MALPKHSVPTPYYIYCTTLFDQRRLARSSNIAFDHAVVAICSTFCTTPQLRHAPPPSPPLSYLMDCRHNKESAQRCPIPLKPQSCRAGSVRVTNPSMREPASCRDLSSDLAIRSPRLRHEEGGGEEGNILTFCIP